jgi:WD40 repeat protein
MNNNKKKIQSILTNRALAVHNYPNSDNVNSEFPHIEKNNSLPHLHLSSKAPSISIVENDENNFQAYTGFWSVGAHKGPITCLSYCEDLGMLISGSLDGYLKLFQLHSLVEKIKLFSHNNGVKSFCWSKVNRLYKNINIFIFIFIFIIIFYFNYYFDIFVKGYY